MDALSWKFGEAEAALFRFFVDVVCFDRTFPAALVFELGRGVCAWGWVALSNTTGFTDGGRASGVCT